MLKPDHPRADNNDGYVHQAVLVLEQKLGRSLRDDEEPHHTNGIKYDNRPENLLAVTRSEHARLHYPKGSRFGKNSRTVVTPKDE